MSATSDSSIVDLRSLGGKPSAIRSSQEKATAAGLRVLVVDSDPTVQKACRELSPKLNLSVQAVASLAAAQTVLLKQPIDLLLLDLNLKEPHGVQQFEGLRTSYPEMAIVIATASSTVEAALLALRMGAADFLTTPLAMEELTKVLERAAQRKISEAQAQALHGRLSDATQVNALVGHSPAMEKLYRIVSKVAFSNHPVLIVGESGTGKELVARTIHNNGPHANGPFVPIYCSSMNGETLERELFGYVKGAFPEAGRAKTGLFSEADSGTIFFDGVGHLPLELQSKLVRVLQERTFRPIGARDSVALHARILASADDNLSTLQEHGQFRRDLYFRLNVVNIHVPRLTERRDDIPLLADHILRRIRQDTSTPYDLSSDAREMLLAYEWPGNVRELESALERACVIASSPLLTANDFPTQLRQNSFAETTAPGGHAMIVPKSLRVASIADLEKEAILNTIQQLRGDKLKAARLLGIGKTTLYRKLKEYGIDIPNFN